MHAKRKQAAMIARLQRLRAYELDHAAQVAAERERQAISQAATEAYDQAVAAEQDRAATAATQAIVAATLGDLYRRDG